MNKPIQELIEAVRVEQDSYQFDLMTHYGFDETEAYRKGHRAACDRLIPALLEATSALSEARGYAEDGLRMSTSMFDEAIEKIRNLLGAK